MRVIKSFIIVLVITIMLLSFNAINASNNTPSTIKAEEVNVKQQEENNWITICVYHRLNYEPVYGKGWEKKIKEYIVYDLINKKITIKEHTDGDVIFDIIKMKIEKSGIGFVCQNGNKLYTMFLIINNSDAGEGYHNFDLLIIDPDNNQTKYHSILSNRNPL